MLPIVVSIPTLSQTKKHIINGNKFYKIVDVANFAVKKPSYELTQSDNQTHILNYCLNHSGKFSCAIDSFLEISFAIFKGSLQNLDLNDFNYFYIKQRKQL